jgi:hypothetical protein
MILIWSQPGNPSLLWDNFAESLSEDYIYQKKGNPYFLAYNDINTIVLQITQKTLDHFNIPCPDYATTAAGNEMAISRTSGATTPTSINLEEEEIGVDTLNKDQHFIFLAIMKQLKQKHRNDQRRFCFFIDGPGGTGKTYLYNILIRALKRHGIQFLSVAWTGIAANLLPSGTTVHSRFKLPLTITGQRDQSWGLNYTDEKSVIPIRDAKVIIWDEAPMAPKEALHMIHLGLQDLMKNRLPFGGKTMILGGDFRQLLPVIKGASTIVQISSSIKFSYLWRLFRSFSLSINMRVRKSNSAPLPSQCDENESLLWFTSWLLDLGNGALNRPYPYSATLEVVDIPPRFIVDTEEEIINHVYGDILHHQQGNLSYRPQQIDLPRREFAAGKIIERVILCSTNKQTERLNNLIIDQWPSTSPAVVYSSIDEPSEDQSSETTVEFPIEYLNSITPNGLPPHRLTLKVGAMVVLLRNINTPLGLCNGARLMIEDMQAHVLKCRLLTGSKSGSLALIPRIPFEPTEGDALPFSFKRRQFPLRLAFAMTINKAQGQTFTRVGVHLDEPVFSHGQLYVACSRSTTPSGLKILINPTLLQQQQQQSKRRLPTNSGSTTTINIVHKQLLSL